MFGFNPLDRGNLYQMQKTIETQPVPKMFQSPRSGKFVSDMQSTEFFLNGYIEFQSPRSGKFVSDSDEDREGEAIGLFQSPRSGKFVSDFDISQRSNFRTSVSIP